LGRGFAFTDYHFSWICSDLDSFPVGRAVAASSAVPVVFSPIALRNYSGRQGCIFSPRVGVKQKKSKIPRAGEERLNQSLSIAKYRNGEQYPYLHLVDGGVSDNLGIRSLLDMVTFSQGDMWKLLKSYRMSNTKKMVFVVVNASSFFDPNIPKKQIAPSTLAVIDATTTIQSNQYNVETLELLRSQFPKWQKQIKTGRCKERHTQDCADIQFSLIEVSLGDLQKQERKKLLYVPTSLELPPATVDLLKQAGRNLLRRSEAYQQLLKQL
jgi:NTE family protein